MSEARSANPQAVFLLQQTDVLIAVLPDSPAVLERKGSSVCFSVSSFGIVLVFRETFCLRWYLNR